MKLPARIPAARSMADVYAHTDPLPLVPAMWIAFQVNVLSWIRRLMRARPGKIMALFLSRGGQTWMRFGDIGCRLTDKLPVWRPIYRYI